MPNVWRLRWGLGFVESQQTFPNRKEALTWAKKAFNLTESEFVFMSRHNNMTWLPKTNYYEWLTLSEITKITV